MALKVRLERRCAAAAGLVASLVRVDCADYFGAQRSDDFAPRCRKFFFNQANLVVAVGDYPASAGPGSQTAGKKQQSAAYIAGIFV